MNFKTLLKGCTVFNLFTLMLHLSVFYAPAKLVAWGKSIESPIWAGIFNNSSTVHVLGLEYPSYIPLICIILVQLFIIYHYFKPVKEYLSVNPLPYINNSKGFTLIEAMVCIAIIGILCTIGYQVFDIDKYRLRGAATEFYGMMQYSKSLAVKNNRNVYIGVDSDHYDIWIDDEIYRSIASSNGFTFTSSDIAAGEIGATESPRFVPPDVMKEIEEQCPGSLSESCVPFMNWVNSFKGTKYEHVTIISPRSTITIGYGTYEVVGKTTKIPITLNVAGGLSLGNQESI